MHNINAICVQNPHPKISISRANIRHTIPPNIINFPGDILFINIRPNHTPNNEHIECPYIQHYKLYTYERSS